MIGAPVAAFKRLLQPSAAEPAREARKAGLSRHQMNALLERLFEHAGTLAAREGSAPITESHLGRAHLDRLGFASGNLYERAAIDTRRLRRYLETYSAEPAELVVGGARPAAPRAASEQVSPVSSTRGCSTSSGRSRWSCRLSSAWAPASPSRAGRSASSSCRATGVGKTELARAMAEAVFGSGSAAPLIKVDCGKLTERHDIVQLIGARQGLVGYKEGQLTNALAAQPESVILFDEAEKADEHIWQSLLGFFDDGTLQEADGTEYDATHCLIVATSNRGYREPLPRAGLRRSAQGTETRCGRRSSRRWKPRSRPTSLRGSSSAASAGRTLSTSATSPARTTSLLSGAAAGCDAGDVAGWPWARSDAGGRRLRAAGPARLRPTRGRSAACGASDHPSPARRHRRRLGRDRGLSRFTFKALEGSESLALEASHAAD